MNPASLLNAVTPILNSKTAKITMDISAASTEGELMVVVKPLVGPVSDKAPEELRLLSAALANRAAALDAAISAAAAKDAKKGPKKATEQTTAAASDSPGPVNTTQDTDTSTDSDDSTVSAGFDL